MSTPDTPSPSIDDVISNSVYEATGGEEGRSLEPAPEETDLPAEDAAVEDTASASAATDTPAEEAPVSEDPEGKEWDSLGFQKQEPGKDNRIPWSRVRKTFANKFKQWNEGKSKELQALEAKAKADVEKVTGEFAPKAQRLEVLERAAWLAENHPEKYLELLKINPRYATLLTPAAAAAVKQELAEQTGDDQEPRPDAQTAEGVAYYSKDGLAKWEAWHERKVGRAVTKQVMGEMDKQYGPLRKKMETEAEVAKSRETVKGWTDWAKGRFGPLYEKHEADVAAAWKHNPGLTFHQVVTDTLTPFLVADENTIRERVTKELSQRPKAAESRAPRQASKANDEADDSSGDPITDAINRAVKRATAQGA